MYKIYLSLLFFLFTLPLNAQTVDGLIAYYPMDGNAEDEGGSEFDGQLLFGVSTAANRFGEAGKALSFDGINDFIEVPDAAPLRLGGSYTISFWILIDDFVNELAYSILSKRTGIIQDGYALQVIGTEHPSLMQGEFSLLVSSGSVPSIQSGTTITQGNWQNVLICYDAATSTCKMFFDGAEVSSQVIPAANDETIATLKIGVDDQSILNNFYFKGTLDELRLYDRVLNEEEKDEVVLEGNCDDGDCSTIDIYNQDTGLCEHIDIEPENCDDGDCQTEDAFNTTTCECENEPITIPDCDDNDCQTIDFYNLETCLCENNEMTIPVCEDNDCNTIDSYNTDICECEYTIISPPDCDDGDCETADIYNSETCLCENEPLTVDSCDDDDCTTTDFYNTDTCECENEPISPLDCDDDNCETVDFYNTETCLCENEPLAVDSCDDDDCTTSDFYNAEICECENIPISALDCNDENCETEDFYNSETCLCENNLITPLDCDDKDCTTTDSYNLLTCECEHFFIENSENIFIPNAISPNEDGINDKWIIYGGECIEAVRSIIIYDRWGSLVYESKDYIINTNMNAWNGEIKGQGPNQGTFVYVVEIIHANGELETISGEIHLVK